MTDIPANVHDALAAAAPGDAVEVRLTDPVTESNVAAVRAELEAAYPDLLFKRIVGGHPTPAVVTLGA